MEKRLNYQAQTDRNFFLQFPSTGLHTAQPSVQPHMETESMEHGTAEESWLNIVEKQQMKLNMQSIFAN
ncbi:unnamed protein product [Citrullus colocynthis]|uniref:Uncharacterized protein n=1 Tax=Citrullus colocynthis TaxID=252529 RepID=A0ABP0Y3C2_9ROSI